MSVDISEAIALAKDLLRTSSDFRAHDPEMAAQFAGRAYEICDDLGIDRAELGEAAPSLEPVVLVEESDVEEEEEEDDDPAEEDDESDEINLQLRHLLQQQAQVLREIEEAEAASPPKTKKRSFRLFGRTEGEENRELQSA